jgi:hypothetical protein
VVTRLFERVHRLRRRRRAALISLLVAFLATVYALYQPSLSGPHARALTFGTATTELLISSPNLNVGTQDSYVTDVDHAVLLADVMSTQPVLGAVARQMHISPNSIQATTPMTANVPRVVSDPGSGAAAKDLVDSTDLYKLEVQADPSVPILYIDTQAPTEPAAVALASSAVQSLIAYSGTVSGKPGSSGPQLGVQQLGPIKGVTAGSGANKEIALIVFVGTFGIMMWFITLATQLRRGWVAARDEARLQPRLEP